MTNLFLKRRKSGHEINGGGFYSHPRFPIFSLGMNQRYDRNENVGATWSGVTHNPKIYVSLQNSPRLVIATKIPIIGHGGNIGFVILITVQIYHVTVSVRITEVQITVNEGTITRVARLPSNITSNTVCLIFGFYFRVFGVGFKS